MIFSERRQADPEAAQGHAHRQAGDGRPRPLRPRDPRAQAAPLGLHYFRIINFQNLFLNTFFGPLTRLASRQMPPARAGRPVSTRSPNTEVRLILKLILNFSFFFNSEFLQIAVIVSLFVTAYNLYTVMAHTPPFWMSKGAIFSFKIN